MKKIFYKTDSSNYSEKVNEYKGKSFFDLNSADIIEKKFDLNGYLTFMEKQIEFEKRLKNNKKTINVPNKFQTISPFNRHNSSNIGDMNNSSKFSFSNFNTHTHIKTRSDSYNTFTNPLNINNNNKQKFGISTFTNTYSNSIHNKSRKCYIPNINKSNTCKNIIRKNKTIKYGKTITSDGENDSEDDEENFSVSKTIKEIRKNCFLTGLSKNCKYNKKQADIIYDSNKILTNFKNKNYIKLEEKGKILSSFLDQNKEISKKNLLIKLMNHESTKLIEREEKLSHHLVFYKNQLENDEQKFNDYINLQKTTCKKLEHTLSVLQVKNKDLKEEQKMFKDLKKMKKDEIKKVLSQINDCLFYANFTNEVLGADTSRFAVPIIPEYFEPYTKYDFNKITEEVVQKYGCDPPDPPPGKKKEGYFLVDPENMYHKYREIEDNTLRLFNTKLLVLNEIKDLEKQNNDSLSYLKDRCHDLEIEYNQLVEIYDERLEKYNLFKGNEIEESDIMMIKDLFGYIIKIFYPNKKIKLNEVEDYIHEGTKILLEKEKVINDYLRQITNEEESDPKIFEGVMDYMKNLYKEHRQYLFKENKIKTFLNLKEKAVQKAKKIVIISRKSEPPFHINKKKQKDKIDYNAIKQNEEKELMYYQ